MLAWAGDSGTLERGSCLKAGGEVGEEESRMRYGVGAKSECGHGMSAN